MLEGPTVIAYMRACDAAAEYWVIMKIRLPLSGPLAVLTQGVLLVT
jgi:hypothetical protein